MREHTSDAPVDEPGAERPPSRRRLGALAGLLAAALAVGAGELVAALLGRTSSPVVAVGGAFIDATPRWLKDFAVSTFGTNDKTALLVGIGLTIAVLSALLGVLALRRLVVAQAGVAVLGLLAAAAALSRPGAAGLDVVPALLAAAAGAFALGRLVQPVAVGSEGALDRRGFLTAAVVVGGAAAVTGGVGRSLLGGRVDTAASRAAVRLPRPVAAASPPAGTGLRVDGLSPFRTPNADFYRIDTALVVPQLTTKDWRLRVHGMVEHELTLTFDQLLARGLVEHDVTLACVSNEVGGDLVGNARWLGAPLKDLLEEAGVRPGADQLLSRSVDGMTIGTPVPVVMDGRAAMLAVGMNGEPLPVEHGFPVRMVVPGLYGYVSATKWVVDLELTTFDAVDPYWVKRGWAPRGPVKTAARIDTPGSSPRAPGRVPVAGVAWAQHRGIAKVEVRVDGGPWHEAELAQVPSADTWVQWVWMWDATPGTHTLQVRATDRTGTTQPETRVPPFPDGATGWHTVVVPVTGSA
ncbi:MAG: sulfite oxidase [Motilibacteraceae bacterium]